MIKVSVLSTVIYVINCQMKIALCLLLTLNCKCLQVTIGAIPVRYRENTFNTQKNLNVYICLWNTKIEIVSTLY